MDAIHTLHQIHRFSSLYDIFGLIGASLEILKSVAKNRNAKQVSSLVEVFCSLIILLRYI